MGHTRNETPKQINYNEKIEIKTSQLFDSIGRGAFASNEVELMDVKVEKFYVNSSMENCSESSWISVPKKHIRPVRRERSNGTDSNFSFSIFGLEETHSARTHTNAIEINCRCQRSLDQMHFSHRCCRCNMWIEREETHRSTARPSRSGQYFLASGRPVLRTFQPTLISSLFFVIDRRLFSTNAPHHRNRTDHIRRSCIRCCCCCWSYSDRPSSLRMQLKTFNFAIQNAMRLMSWMARAFHGRTTARP